MFIYNVFLADVFFLNVKSRNKSNGQMDTFSISLEINKYLDCTMLFNVC